MKGLSFTLIITLMILVLINLFFLRKSLVSYEFEETAVRNRVMSLKNFYESIVEDASNAMDISSKRAISACISKVITEGKPLTDAKTSIEILVLNGSFNGSIEPLMEGSTLFDWKEKIEYVAKNNGYEVSISILNFSIGPYDSFNLLAVFNFSINLTDANKIAYIKRNQTVTKLISLENFEDPLYPLNTLGRISSVIVKGPYIPHTTLDQLKDDLNNTYYYPSLYGASFLDRLEGKYFVQEKYERMSDKVIGLESLVDKDKLASAGLSVNIEQTNIDYLYFSDSSVTSYKISGMPENFRLDNESTINNLTHLQFYNVSELVE